MQESVEPTHQANHSHNDQPLFQRRLGEAGERRLDRLERGFPPRGPPAHAQVFPPRRRPHLHQRRADQKDRVHTGVRRYLRGEPQGEDPGAAGVRQPGAGRLGRLQRLGHLARTRADARQARPRGQHALGRLLDDIGPRGGHCRGPLLCDRQHVGLVYVPYVWRLLVLLRLCAHGRRRYRRQLLLCRRVRPVRCHILPPLGHVFLLLVDMHMEVYRRLVPLDVPHLVLCPPLHHCPVHLLRQPLQGRRLLCHLRRLRRLLQHARRSRRQDKYILHYQTCPASEPANHRRNHQGLRVPFHSRPKALSFPFSHMSTCLILYLSSL